ncbi:LuxR C-terminal-related transcriptional regulator [Candidatus Uabimicrobium amorphum]|uniref:DNA-binding response regulator n=1 Tax=Uabimicrobium amorphum TaxID=2596890 RepID=A0A5S9F536_UABAM|nr:response regulator transcription factor [Candidatus Uabimicrobium amorphum]BBM86198.1 DNA-binding response regulator [Candidatus Uabimicrobium amorphum]
MSNTKICIVDSHPIVCRGLKILFYPHKQWDVCAVASTAREAFIKIAECGPHIVISDFPLPDMCGIDFIDHVCCQWPQTHVLVFSCAKSREFVECIFHAGARGYVCKSDDDKEVVQAISTMALGEVYFRERRQRKTVKRKKNVTSREMQVLQMIAKGLSTTQISQRLFVSRKTIETHKHNIKRKLNLRNATELSYYAIKMFS